MSNSNIAEQDLKTFFPDPVIVKIADKEKKEVIDFEVKEFVFGNRIKFVKIISNIFVDVYVKRPEVQSMGNIEAITALIEVAGDRMADIYAMVLDRDVDWVRNNLTLKKEVELLTAIFEVNEIPLLIGQIQKAIATAKQ